MAVSPANAGNMHAGPRHVDLNRHSASQSIIDATNTPVLSAFFAKQSLSGQADLTYLMHVMKSVDAAPVSSGAALGVT
jgi:hypothetical protein